MADFTIRPMRDEDRDQVAELIYLSTNYWYESRGKGPIFSGGPQVAHLFFDVYSQLAGSAGLVAQGPGGGVIGSCFYHRRPSHFSLGIMNAHPSYSGQGVASSLLKKIVGLAEEQNLSLRLVSSALNLDSFSLYSRAGFTPRRIYQDLILPVPEAGLGLEPPTQVRPATGADGEAIAQLELELSGVYRPADYSYFLGADPAVWRGSVWHSPSGQLEGFLFSCAAPGCRMLGPGTARTQNQAADLLLAQLDCHRGASPVFLLPSDCPELVRQAYGWGARNCELHFGQVRGDWQIEKGVTMPTFMPESG